MSILDQKHPITDVVVLTYNNWKLSETCIHYILKNTIDFNLIIVDNGSCDDTVANVKKLQKKHTNITLIENRENKGVAGGRNIGAQAGSAEFILNIDNDQLVDISNLWLEELFAIMFKCNVQMVGVDAWQIRPPRALKPYYPTKHCLGKLDNIILAFCGGNKVMGSAISANMLKKNLHKFKALICHTKLEKDYTFSQKISVEKTHLIPIGVDLEEFDNTLTTTYSRRIEINT